MDLPSQRIASFEIKFEKIFVIVVANIYRSSCPEVFCRKGVLENSTKFTGKHQYLSLFFNKVTGLRPEGCHFIKKETLAKVFSCEFCEIFKNTFSPEQIRTTASDSHKSTLSNYRRKHPSHPMLITFIEYGLLVTKDKHQVFEQTPKG